MTIWTLLLREHEEETGIGMMPVSARIISVHGTLAGAQDARMRAATQQAKDAQPDLDAYTIEGFIVRD